MKLCDVCKVFKPSFRVTFVKATHLEVFSRNSTSVTLRGRLSFQPVMRTAVDFKSWSTLTAYSSRINHLSKRCNYNVRNIHVIKPTYEAATLNRFSTASTKFDIDNKDEVTTRFIDDSNNTDDFQTEKLYTRNTQKAHMLDIKSRTLRNDVNLLDTDSVSRTSRFNKLCLNLYNMSSIYTNNIGLNFRDICDRQSVHNLIFKRGYSWYTLTRSGTSNSGNQKLLQAQILPHTKFNLQKRFKRKKAISDGNVTDDTDNDSDSEEEEEEDYDAPLNYKEMVVHVKSLRADSIISSGLDLSRNRVDEVFFSSLLRCNNLKLLKKSRQLKVGDFVDVITEKLEDKTKVKVKRVKVVKISSERTNKDKMIVSLRVWKSPFVVSTE